MAFGSDMYIDVESFNLTQGQAAKSTLYSYVDHGLAPKDVLIMATKNGAELVNDNLAGSIKVGGYADFIVLKSNPLKNIRALEDIVMVVSKGKIIINKLSSEVVK